MGKTSICRRFELGFVFLSLYSDLLIISTDTYDEILPSSVGVSFISKEKVLDGKSVVLQIWDTGNNN